MAAIGEVSEFVEEIAFLESMFGGTVSATVIGSVIESCGGNGKQKHIYLLKCSTLI